MRQGAFACALLAAASSAMASKISTSTSSYGVGQNMTVINANANVDGFDVFEGVIATTSTTGGYVFDYQILTDANNSSLSNFDFTLPLANLDTLFPLVQPYGVLGCDSTNDPLITQCVTDPETNSVVQSIVGPTLINSSTAVQFYVPGNGEGLAFYVTEDLSSAPTSVPTPQIDLVTATPEPQLLAIVSLAIMAIVLFRRRRSMNLG